MFYYIIVFLLILYAVYIGKGFITNANKWIFYVVIPFFICFGYTTGSDWRNYELLFYNQLPPTVNEPAEPGYEFIANIFKFFGFGFWEFSIVIKLIGYYIFIHFYRKYSSGYIWGLIYWFASYALFLWIDHPVRNFIAILLFSFAIDAYVEKKCLKFILMCAIASSFHFTCLAVIPLYFVPRKMNERYYRIALIIIPIVYFFSSLLRNYIDILVQLQVFSKLSSYGGEDYQGQMPIIRFVIIEGILLLSVFNIKRIRQFSRYADVVLIMSLIYGLLFSVGNLNTILFRLQYFLFIPFVIQISFLCSPVIRKHIRTAMRMFVVVFSLIYLVNLVTRDSRYVPYTNYAFYMFGDKPSYDYRDKYNEINSPYKGQ